MWLNNLMFCWVLICITSGKRSIIFWEERGKIGRQDGQAQGRETEYLYILKLIHNICILSKYQQDSLKIFLRFSLCNNMVQNKCYVSQIKYQYKNKRKEPTYNDRSKMDTTRYRIVYVICFKLYDQKGCMYKFICLYMQSNSRNIYKKSVTLAATFHFLPIQKYGFPY